MLVWVGSTALLVHKSYFPDAGRFPRVENSRVADLYFDQGQTTDLLLVMARRGAVGRFTVTPRRYSVRLTEAALARAVGEIFFTGRFDPTGLPGAAAAAGEVVWNGSIFLNRELGSEGLRLQVRLPQLNLVGQISVGGSPGRVAYQLKQGTVVLADSTNEAKNRELMAQMAFMGKMAGAAVPSMEALEGWPAMLEGLDPEVVCRHGQFGILGRRYDGYMVKIKWSPELQVNLLVTEMGELLRLEGIPQVDVIAESFVPEDLMEPEEGLDDP